MALYDQRSHRPTRLKPTRLAALVAIGLTLAVFAGPPSPAHAEPVTVPFIDRLGCGATDEDVVPVFGYAGSGTAENGAPYMPTVAASSYAGVTGEFSAATANAAFTVYSLDGYGAQSQYRGVEALGFSDVAPGRGLTLSIDLPHAQAIAFTVGGIQSPSRITVAGQGPGGAVSPSVAPRSSAAGAASATSIGDAVRVDGAQGGAGPDAVPERAVDVWFSEPIDRLELTLSPAGSGEDGGFLVTPPVACQSGSITAAAVTSSAPEVDEPAGTVSYEVAFTTTVANDASPGGAALYPSVTTNLVEGLAAQGMTLDSITSPNASGPCALSPSAQDGSRLIEPLAPLSPGESCALAWVASVTMPSSPSERIVSFDSILASSASSAGRIKAAAPTEVRFAGVRPSPGPADPAPVPQPPGPDVAPQSPPASTAAPVPTPTPTPTPTATPTSAPPHANADPAPSAIGPLPVALRLSGSTITPGTTTAMRGILGPNSSDREITVVLTGRVGAGMIYRAASAVGDDPAEASACTLHPRQFVCTVVLGPGEAADLEVYLYADFLNAPAVAVQQLSLASSLVQQNNAVTVATDVARTRDTDTWADALTDFDITTFPAAFLPLLAILLLALAATVAEAERRRSPAARPDADRTRSRP